MTRTRRIRTVLRTLGAAVARGLATDNGWAYGGWGVWYPIPPASPPGRR